MYIHTIANPNEWTEGAAESFFQDVHVAKIIFGGWRSHGADHNIPSNFWNRLVYVKFWPCSA